tara:strand:+ start:347 stop:511 length:165 start_codon:yes stop_codon:yes gene_type:complete
MLTSEPVHAHSEPLVLKAKLFNVAVQNLPLPTSFWLHRAKRGAFLFLMKQEQNE